MSPTRSGRTAPTANASTPSTSSTVRPATSLKNGRICSLAELRSMTSYEKKTFKVCHWWPESDNGQGSGNVESRCRYVSKRCIADHRRLVHLKRKYPCSKCNEEFAHRSQIRNHLPTCMGKKKIVKKKREVRQPPEHQFSVSSFLTKFDQDDVDEDSDEEINDTNHQHESVENETSEIASISHIAPTAETPSIDSAPDDDDMDVEHSESNTENVTATILEKPATPSSSLMDQHNLIQNLKQTISKLEKDLYDKEIAMQSSEKAALNHSKVLTEQLTATSEANGVLKAKLSSAYAEMKKNEESATNVDRFESSKHSDDSNDEMILLEARLNEITLAKSKLEEEIESIRKENKCLESELAELKKVQLNADEIKKLRDDEAYYRKECHHLTDQLKLNPQSSSLSATLATKQKEITTLRQRNEKLTDEMSALKVENENLKMQKEKISFESKSDKATITRLQHHIDNEQGYNEMTRSVASLIKYFSNPSLLSNGLGSLHIGSDKDGRRTEEEQLLLESMIPTYQEAPVSRKTMGSFSIYRPIIIDGANVAGSYRAAIGLLNISHSPEAFGYEGIEVMVETLIKALPVNYDNIKVILPHANVFLGDEAKDAFKIKHPVLDRLDDKGVLLPCPYGEPGAPEYDDVLILAFARVVGGVVISNDAFKDIYQPDKYWKLSKFENVATTRRIQFIFCLKDPESPPSLHFTIGSKPMYSGNGNFLDINGTTLSRKLTFNPITDDEDAVLID